MVTRVKSPSVEANRQGPTTNGVSALTALKLYRSMRRIRAAEQALTEEYHPADRENESYHMIEGRMTVLVFNDSGTVTHRIELGEYGSGKSCMYRLSSSLWHMPLPRSDWVLYHETFTGPFVKERDVEYASWAPEEDNDADASVYMENLRKQVEGFTQ